MVFEGGFYFLKKNVIFDPIDRIWTFVGFQPSVHSETASSAIFYLWVWKMTFSSFENPGILSTPRWLYIQMYTHALAFVWARMHVRLRSKSLVQVLASKFLDSVFSARARAHKGWWVCVWSRFGCFSELKVTCFGLGVEP